VPVDTGSSRSLTFSRLERDASTMSITSASTPSLAGSSILRESPPFGIPSNTGPGGADLSLSELYISDRSEDASPQKPFSLLPQRAENEEGIRYNDEEDVFGERDGEAEAGEDGATMTEKGKSSANTARMQEERLQHDLFVLKKLNSSFAMYNDALKDARSSTEVSPHFSMSVGFLFYLLILEPRMWQCS